MSNQPDYRRRKPQGDFVARNGIIGPGFLILCVVVLVGFWPVLAVHGQTDTGGWRWDIHSTYAELAYLGAIAFITGLVWLGNRPAKTAVAVPVTPERLPPPPPSIAAAPACGHPNAVKVDSALDRSVIYRCWCPDCEAELPANFRRPCCGTEPGNPHWHSCPESATGTRRKGASR